MDIHIALDRLRYLLAQPEETEDEEPDPRDSDRWAFEAEEA
jgi:hypothetical protein